MLLRCAAGACGRRTQRSGRGVTPRHTMRHESVLNAKLKLVQPTSARRAPSRRVTHGFICDTILSCKARTCNQEDRERDSDSPVPWIRLWGVLFFKIRKTAGTH